MVIATCVVGNVQRPFNLAVYDMGREKATAQGIDLLLYHGSTDAPEVDVVVDGGPVLFDNIEYGEFQGYVNVPAGNYRLRLTPASDNATTVQTYVADLSGAAGAAATVFASGFLGGDAPGFEVWVALADGTTFALPTAPTSILQLGDKLDYMRVAPNPAADLVQLQYGLKDNLDLSLRIFDATGRLVGSQYLGRQQAGNYTQPLDLSGLPGGVYSLSLVSDRGVATQRIIVKR